MLIVSSPENKVALSQRIVSRWSPLRESSACAAAPHAEKWRAVAHQTRLKWCPEQKPDSKTRRVHIVQYYILILFYTVPIYTLWQFNSMMNDEVKMKIRTEIPSNYLPQGCSSCVATSQGGKGCNDIHSAFDEEPWRVFWNLWEETGSGPSDMSRKELQC